MSGGSWQYLYDKIDDAADRLITGKRVPERIAFGHHMKKVAAAMHDIEWVDSCDYGCGAEIKAIDAVLLGPNKTPVDVAIELLQDAITIANETMAKARL